MATTYSPGRPPTERDMLHAISGNPVFLGAIVSTGAAVSNMTTATPFNIQVPNVPQPALTLGGKVLLIQPSGPGFFLPSQNLSVTVASQLVLPAAQNTIPGVAISEGERVIVTMLPTSFFLQWLPFGPSGNLLVWELQ